MSTFRRPAAVATVCAVVLVSGCAGSGDVGPSPVPESPPAASRSEAAEVVPGEGTFVEVDDADRADVESTAEVAALMLHSWDTLTDHTQTAAAIRVKPLMNYAWAGHQVEPERNGAQGAWLEPSRHQAYSSPSIVPAAGDVNRDVSEDKAIRVYDVNWRWISRDSTQIQTAGRQLVTLYWRSTTAGGTWSATSFRSQPDERLEHRLQYSV